ncbi:MAG: S24 family peptidase [Clostridia bacterium]|nr:S24 family peptidase [Clostridia bacterium]
MRSKNPELMREISEYITEYFIEHSVTPSTTQIAEKMGIVRSTAFKYLVEMDKKGMVEYHNGDIYIPSLNTVETGKAQVLALGSIVCGDPVQEEAQLLYKTSVPTAVFGNGPFYLLTASGDSMEDAGIMDGDMLLIRKQSNANRGDIIVALDEDSQNTLKKFEGFDEEKGCAVLAYQNKAVYGDKKIYVKELTCQGVLTHIIKQL